MEQNKLTGRLFRLLSFPVIAILLAFNIRRLVFMVAGLAPPVLSPPSLPAPGATWPELLLLAALRNEEEMIEGLCQSLASLDYPKDRLHVVLVDDGSHDRTRDRLETFARGQPHWQVLALDRNMGKARALNTALELCPAGEIVVVYDADHRPDPCALSRAIPFFQDPRVGGLSGLTIPANPFSSPTSYYATVEGLVHQMLTMRAKDRLGLAPALLGSNCAYRRAALAAAGGFRAGALLEDSDLTVALARAGYVTHFADQMVSLHQAPISVRGYLRQHARWARGFNDVARDHAFTLLSDARLGWPLRIELFMFISGYLDRLAFVAGAALAGLGLIAARRGRTGLYFPVPILALELLTPLVQVVALFAALRAPFSMWLRLPLVPFFFALDMGAAVKGMVDSILGRARVWTATERHAP